MPQVSPAEFYALPLRVHTFLADVPLHDVWAVTCLCTATALSFLNFYAGRFRTDPTPPMLRPTDFRLVARALFRLRFFLGRIFRLDSEPKDALAASFGSRLTAKDRDRSVVVSGTPEGLFHVVYRFENEQLLEIHNRTVHGAALSALAKRANGYRFYFAIYVRQRTCITPFYRRLIDPFRKWIIYPALLKRIRTTWDRNI
jgi:hypothetical protein